jgi:thiol-disulfide isomerase/thioredoxin
MCLCAAAVFTCGLVSASNWSELASASLARLPLSLVRSPSVQTELAVGTDQAQAIATLVEGVDQPFWRLRDSTSEKGLDEIQSLAGGLQKDLGKILNEKQMERMEQLLLRAQGWQGLQLPSVVNQLHLTEPQQRRYDALLASVKNWDPKRANQLSVIEYRWNQEVLTEPQRSRLRHLTGKPYDFSRERVLAAKAPEIKGKGLWLNAKPTTLGELKGKVVALHFWTFGCINCIHNLPFYQAWQAQFPKEQFGILGIHTPETDTEHDPQQLRKAVAEKRLQFPICTDSQRENWNDWGNQMWPSVYLIDKNGYIRYWWYGELNWKGANGDAFMREKVRQLIAEKEEPPGPTMVPTSPK